MKIKMNLIEKVTLDDFAKKHNLTMEVNEREPRYIRDGLFKYYCGFQGLEVKDGNILTSSMGQGDTIDEAIRNYVPKISNTLVVLDAYTMNRKEIMVPALIPEWEAEL